MARHVLQQQLMIHTHIAIGLFMYEAVVVRQYVTNHDDDDDAL